MGCQFIAGHHLHSWVEGEDSKVSCPRKQGDDRARSWIPFFASEARWPKQYTNAPRRRSFEHLPLNLWFLERGTWNIALGFSGPKISHSVIMFRYFMIYPLTNNKCRFFSFLSFSLSSFLHRGFVGFYATLTGELISVWNLVCRSARFLSFRYDRGLWIKGKKSRFAYFHCNNTLRPSLPYLVSSPMCLLPGLSVVVVRHNSQSTLRTALFFYCDFLCCQRLNCAAVTIVPRNF